MPGIRPGLSVDHDGLRWTFLKQHPEDLCRLYGLGVTEAIVWLPLFETVGRHRSNGTSARPFLLGTTPIGRRKFGATVDRRGILRMSETSMFQEVFGEDPLAVRRVDPERYLELGDLPLPRRCCSASHSGARPIRAALAR